MKADKRRSVRVNSQNGLAIIRTGGSKPITCRLSNLSEGGCRLFIEAKDTAIWNTISKPGQLLELVMTNPPHLDRFLVNADVKNVKPCSDPDGIELGVQFRTMEPKRCGILRLALLKLATDRLRLNRASPIEELLDANIKANAAQFQAAQASAEPASPEPEPAKPSASQFLRVLPANLSPAEFSGGSSRRSNTEKITRKNNLGSNATSYWQDPYHGKRIGEVLVGMGKLTQQQVETFAEESRHTRERFGQFLVKRGVVTGPEILRALALATGIPTTDLHDAPMRRTFREIFSLELMRRYEFIPFDANEKVVCIATGTPFPEPVLNEIKSNTRKRVEVFLAEEQFVLQLLDKTAEECAQEASTMKNRRFPRFNMPLPTSYFFCTSSGERLEDTTYSGQTLNISEGGFRIEGPRADLGSFGNVQNYGMYVKLSVKFMPHEFNALCKPVFVYEKETLEEPQFPFEMGLAIMDISASHKQQLLNIIEIVRKLTNPTSV